MREREQCRAKIFAAKTRRVHRQRARLCDSRATMKWTGKARSVLERVTCCLAVYHAVALRAESTTRTGVSHGKLRPHAPWRKHLDAKSALTDCTKHTNIKCSVYASPMSSAASPQVKRAFALSMLSHLALKCSWHFYELVLRTTNDRRLKIA